MNNSLMLAQLLDETREWWKFLVQILLLYLGVWVVYRMSDRLAKGVLKMRRFASPILRVERRKLLRGLLAGIFTFVAFLIATLLTLRLLNVSNDSIVWAVGLFAAAFGLSARPIVSDFIAGIGFLFEDPFGIDEKIELASDIQGVVASVNLRTTQLVAPTGEIFTIPNGEIRIIRNFSRGRFSMADVTIKIDSADLENALALLHKLGKEAPTLLPNLLESWQIISEEGMMGKETELTLIAKAKYGQAATLRPDILAILQKHFMQEEIDLMD